VRRKKKLTDGDIALAKVHAALARNSEAQAQHYARLVTMVFNDHLRDFLKKLEDTRRPHVEIFNP
jgi:hypothetical protein